MTGLPQGWSWTTFGALAAPEVGAFTDGPFGSNLKSEHYSTSGARVIRLQNIGRGEFRDERAYIPLEQFQKLSRHEIRAGDLAFASLSDSPPRVCIIPDLQELALVKADCIRARLHEEVSQSFVLAMLLSPTTRAYLRQLIRGVGRPRLGLGQIRSIPVPIAPKAEQHRIVEILDRYRTQLGSAKADLASADARSVLYLDRQLDPITIPTSVERVPLGELLSEPLRNGRSARAITGRSGIRVLTLTAITRGLFTDEFTKVVDVPEKEVENLWLRDGDILVQRSNTPDLVGSSATFRGPERWAIFPDLLIRVRPDPKLVAPDYIAAVLSAKSTRLTFRGAARGLAGSMPKIDQGQIAAVPIPMLSKDQQTEWVARTAKNSEQINRLSSVIRATLNKSDLLDDELLHAAFCGRLVNQDPSDEPASALLARIHSEHEAAISKKRTRRKREAAAQ